jgi:hypothetical protein
MKVLKSGKPIGTPLIIVHLKATMLPFQGVMKSYPSFWKESFFIKLPQDYASLAEDEVVLFRARFFKNMMAIVKYAEKPEKGDSQEASVSWLLSG